MAENQTQEEELPIQLEENYEIEFEEPIQIEFPDFVKEKIRKFAEQNISEMLQFAHKFYKDFTNEAKTKPEGMKVTVTYRFKVNDEKIMIKMQAAAVSKFYERKVYDSVRSLAYTNVYYDAETNEIGLYLKQFISLILTLAKNIACSQIPK